MRIHILEPFFGESHKHWAKGYQHHSCHDVEIVALPGSYWKWRMMGGAVSMARKYWEGFFSVPDLWLASDMLDLATFLGLMRKQAERVPVVAYFHENQLTYPWSPHDEDPLIGRDLHYAFINYTTALAADMICFNSQWHRDVFLDALPNFLRRFPDRRERGLLEGLHRKAKVLPLGMELKALDTWRVARHGGAPVVLWNHRWEYDKGPEAFFQALFQLAEEGIAFRVVVLGEAFARTPAIFAKAREKLADRILHWGFVSSRQEYVQWLWRADLLPVTSQQDFFGISVLEAVWCGCRPLLPKRLAYVEHFPQPEFEPLFYENDEAFLPRLRQLLQQWHIDTQQHWPAKCRCAIAHYDWSVQAPAYDALWTTTYERK